jgi:hypothetical protein
LPLPTEFTSSIDTDDQILSVYTDGITDGMLRIKKKGRFADVGLLRVFFTDGIIEGFKMSAPYGDVTDSPMKMLTE